MPSKGASDFTKLQRISSEVNASFSATSNGVTYAGQLSVAGLSGGATVIEFFKAVNPFIPQADQSSIRSPTDLCSDNSGNLYIADSTRASVYKYNTFTKVIERFLGTGSLNTGDSIETNRIASRTPIWQPTNLAFINGRLYVTMFNIFKVIVIEVNGTRVSARNIVSLENSSDLTYLNSVGYDSRGNIFYNIVPGAGSTAGFYKYISTGPNSGTAVKRTIDTVSSNGGTPFLDSAGNMYLRSLTDIVKLSVSASKSIDIDSTATVIMSTGGGNISDFKVDNGGVIYYSILLDNRIVKYSATVNTDLNTSSTRGFSGDNGPIKDANLFPGFINSGGLFESRIQYAIDEPGNLYFIDYGNKRIRKITATNGVITQDSIVTTIIGDGSEGDPYISPIPGLN